MLDCDARDIGCHIWIEVDVALNLVEHLRADCIDVDDAIQTRRAILGNDESATLGNFCNGEAKIVSAVHDLFEATVVASCTVRSAFYQMSGQ